MKVIQKVIVGVVSALALTGTTLGGIAIGKDSIPGETGEQGPKGDTGAQGPKGETGATGKSAYEVYKSNVPSGQTPMTESQWLASLVGTTGANGKSAYDIYKEGVPSGETPMTENQWLASLIGATGATGKSNYEIYKESVPSGETPMTESQWLASLVGATGASGKSAYELYVDKVPEGITPLTEIQWLASLIGDTGANGKSAYDLYKEGVPDGETPMTESEWLDSLKGSDGAAGKSAYEIYLDTVPDGETPMTESEWLNSLKATKEGELLDVSFGRVYREMTMDYAINPSDISSDFEDNFLYNTKLLKDANRVNYLYESCGESSYMLNGHAIWNNFPNLSTTGGYDYGEETFGEYYEIQAEFKNVDNDGTNDVIGLIEFAYTVNEDTFEWKGEETGFEYEQHENEHYDRFEFAIINNEYYAFTNCMKYEDGEPTTAEPGEWNCYYKFDSREDYMLAIATTVYFLDFISANGTICEMLCDYDIDEHTPRIGLADMNFILEKSLYGIGYYMVEDGAEMYVYNNLVKQNPYDRFEIEFGTQRDEKNQLCVLDYSATCLANENSECLYREGLYRTSLVRRDWDNIAFTPTEELGDRVDLDTVSVGDTYLFFVGSIQSNLFENLCFYALADIL